MTSYFSAALRAADRRRRRGAVAARGAPAGAHERVAYGALVLHQYAGAPGTWRASGSPTCGRSCRRSAWRLHRGRQRHRVCRGGAAVRVAGRTAAARRRPPRGGVARAGRPAGVQPARHREPDQRPDHHRPAGRIVSVQSRRRQITGLPAQRVVGRPVGRGAAAPAEFAALDADLGGARASAPTTCTAPRTAAARHRPQRRAPGDARRAGPASS